MYCAPRGRRLREGAGVAWGVADAGGVCAPRLPPRSYGALAMLTGAWRGGERWRGASPRADCVDGRDGHVCWMAVGHGESAHSRAQGLLVVCLPPQPVFRGAARGGECGGVLYVCM